MNIDDFYDGLNLAIKGWNVFGLPATLIVLAIVSLRKPSPNADLDRRKTVGRLGTIHFALAFWSITTIIAELWAYRTMGIFPTNPITGLPGCVIMTAIDLSIGIGLIRVWRSARWGAILWSVYRTGVGGYLAYWFWTYPHLIDWTEWPRDALYWLLPPMEFAFLIAPGTRRAFRKSETTADAPPETTLPIVSTIAGLFLAVALSAGLTDAVDWTARTVAESLLEP